MSRKTQNEAERLFPILNARDIPWAMLAEHEPQALHNHDQNLEMLAARGGLTPEEALAILEDRPTLPWPEAASTLEHRVIAYMRKR